MAVVLRAEVGTPNNINAASATLVTPTSGVGGSVVAGDVAYIFYTRNINEVAPTISGTGWVQIGSTQTSTSMTSCLFRKVLAAGDLGASVTVTPLASGKFQALMKIWSGVDNTTPEDSTPTVFINTTGTTTVNRVTPACTVTTTEALAVEFIGVKTASLTTATPPSGELNVTNIYSSTASSSSLMVGEDPTSYSAGGSAGGRTWVTTQSSQGIYWTILLRPASTGLTMAGPAANINVAALAGSFSSSAALAGPAAAISVAAPAGTLSGTATTLAGPAAAINVAAPAGSIAAAGGVWHHTITEAGQTTVELVSKSTGTSLKYYVSVNADWSSPAYVSTGAAPDTNGYVRATATGLTPGTQYYWKLTDTVASVEGRIADGKTKALGSGAGGFKVAFGGCTTNNNSEGRALTDAASWGPDFWLHLGDYHYHNPTATVTATHLANFEDQIVNSSSGALLALSKNVPMFYNASDHDFGPADNENSDLTDFPGAANALLASAAFFPTGTLADTRSPKVGHYRTWVTKRVRFIQVDIRNTDRSPGEMDQTSSSKTMLGATQLAWLQAQLLQPEPFKVIISDVAWMGTIANQFPTVLDGKDKWPAYPTERATIYNSPRVGHLEIWHSDSHLIGYATPSKNTWGNIPVLCAAPFGNTGGGLFQSTFSAYYNNSPNPVSLYGRVTFTDNGTTITRQFDGYDAIANTVQVTNTVTVVTLAGPAAGVNVAAPAGSISTARTGPAANINTAAPAGAVSTANTMAGPAAAISVTAPAGTISTARTGPAANINTAAPAGSFSSSSALAGPAAAVNVAAPAGSFTSVNSMAGPAAAITVTAPAGSMSGATSLAGPAAAVSVAAPAGSFTTTNTMAGPAANVNVTAPAGSFSTASGLAGPAAAISVAAPAGSFTSANSMAGPAAAISVAAPVGTMGTISQVTKTNATTWAEKSQVTQVTAENWADRARVAPQTLASLWSARVTISGPKTLAINWADRASVAPKTLVTSWAEKMQTTRTMVQNWKDASFLAPPSGVVASNPLNGGENFGYGFIPPPVPIFVDIHAANSLNGGESFRYG
jgi:hypothetical protein